MTLSIPDIDPERDTLGAALAYAKSGWYVLPVDQATKHAGSVLLKGWPAKSSRDTETIIAWFAGTNYALALHVGRSGAIAFDVDHPTALTPLLRAVLLSLPGPFQSTRDQDPERGHYLYAMPDGRHLGNSLGQLGKGWGEIRGKNGIVVVAPSVHEKAADGGHYIWQRTGALPLLPTLLAEQLPDAGDSTDAATDKEVRAFLEQHRTAARPELLHGVLTQFATALATHESRHQIALRATAGAMRESAAGFYPALDAAQRISEAFITAMRTSRDGTERVLSADRARAEFNGILSWAVAQIAVTNLTAVREAVDERLPRESLEGLIAPLQPGPPPFADTPQDDDEQALYDLLGAPTSGAQEEAQERTSWWPRGLGNILDGVEEEPPPAYLARLDGARLFYAGKVNAILGESESGKTWVALLAVVQALEAGVRVVYIDFEDTPAGIVGRLRALGVPDDTIMARLSYIGPDEVLHAAASNDLRELLELARPGLITLDGWNAAMTLLGLDLNSNTDATRFSQVLLKPLAASGAAVVAIDHVPKSKEARGKGGIGAQAKRAMLTGCAITVEVAEPFGRGMTGRLRLYVDKDRAGHVRAISAEAKFAGTAILESDAATGNVAVTIRPPDMRPTVERQHDARAPMKEAICAFLLGNTQATQNMVYRGVKGSQDEIKEALEELVQGEYVVRQKRGQATLHTVVRMFSQLEDLVAPVSGLPVSGVFPGSGKNDDQAGGMTGLPVSVPSGHGGHGTAKPSQTSYLPVSARIGTRLDTVPNPPSNRVPPPPYRGADTVEGTDGRDPSDLIAPTARDAWVQIDGDWVNTTTAEIRTEEPR